MKSRSPFWLLLLASALLLPVMVRSEQPPLPTDKQVRDILRQRIDVEKRGVSIVVGLIDEKGSRVVAYGLTFKDSGRAADGKTIYEIGSVTKTFTDLVLADMVRTGEARLDDPVARYLPKEVKLPTRNGQQITLLDLATHRSGLPRMPDNMDPKDPANPMADYTVGQLYSFLASCELTRDIGSKMEYSNLGVGLLGHALALHAGKSYEALVEERVINPLEMHSTWLRLPKEPSARMAQPYDELLAPTKNTYIAVLAGAGALHSDADDMLKFLAAELGLITTPLSSAMLETQKIRNTANSPTMDIGLGWFIDKTYDPPIWWHNGGTIGYHAFVGFRPATKTGVVVLANTGIDIDDIGQHLLDPRYPLTPAPKPRTAIAIKPEVGAQYVGRYELAPDFILTVTQERDRYFAQATRQGKFEIFPETEADFFFKVVDAQLTFVKDGSGKVTSLVLHQGGDQLGRRLP